MATKISPGCKRLTIDLPIDLAERVYELAAEPPTPIPVSEWIRRVVAHHAKYPMPPLRERMATKARLDGGRKRKRQPAV